MPHQHNHQLFYNQYNNGGIGQATNCHKVYSWIPNKAGQWESLAFGHWISLQAHESSYRLSLKILLTVATWYWAWEICDLGTICVNNTHMGVQGEVMFIMAATIHTLAKVTNSRDDVRKLIWGGGSLFPKQHNWQNNIMEGAFSEPTYWQKNVYSNTVLLMQQSIAPLVGFVWSIDTASNKTNPDLLTLGRQVQSRLMQLDDEGRCTCQEMYGKGHTRKT